MNRLPEAARWYVAHGFAVFPCVPRTKRPATSSGFLDASLDVAAVERMWRKCPNANIGIACDASRVVVLDVDLRNIGAETLEFLERRHGALPPSPTVQTADGWHHYFRAPEGITFSPTAGIGVDIKHHGYVLAPPSIHPSGREYMWEHSARIESTPMGDLPPRWLALIQSRPRCNALVSSGVDARHSFLGCCFEQMNWLGPLLHDGRRMARCPWSEWHSDGRGCGSDSSCVLFPRAEGATLGGFNCSHAHCVHRTWRDVIPTIPTYVRVAARNASRDWKRAS